MRLLREKRHEFKHGWQAMCWIAERAGCGRESLWPPSLEGHGRCRRVTAWGRLPARWLWRRDQRRIESERLVFVDETGKATNIVPRYG